MNDAPADVGAAQAGDGQAIPDPRARLRAWRSTSYLRLFAGGLILPVLLFAILLSWLYVDAERNRAVDQARSAARALTFAIDGSISGPRDVLQALATSPALRAGDIEGFRARVSEMANLLDYVIGVTVPGDARPVMSTAAASQSEAPALDATALKYQKRSVASGGPVVGGLGKRDGVPFVSIYAPVLRQARPIYVLSIDLPAARFTQPLALVRLPDNWSVELVDQQGQVIAHAGRPAAVDERQLPSNWPAEATGTEGVWRGPNVAGLTVVASYVRSPVTGWTTAVTVPVAVLNAPVWKAFWALLAVGGALLAFALATAFWMGSHFAGALSSLQSAAGALTNHADVLPVETRVEEINHVGKVLGRAAADALRREANLRAILATVPSAMIVIDNRGTIRSVSVTTERLFGYRAEELIGGNIRRLMPEPDRSAHDGYMEHYLRTGERRIIGKSRVVTGLKKDGTRFPHELHVGEADVAGEKIFIGFVHDLTERQRIEQELRQTQKMEAIGKLTGGVAHDFNNLLTVIKGNLEMLEARLDGRYREMTTDAQEAVDLAAQLTTSLLAFGRRMPLNPVLSDAGLLVTVTGDLLRRTLGETIEIRTAIKMGCRTVVDSAQLQNALLNLAINARDAMPGGGALTIEVSEAELDQDYAATYPEVRPGHYVLIMVSDTGFGMTPEVRERAFEPFFTTKPQGSGTGLGLSSVYGFVMQSGGHITLYSEEGQGTTIRIYLPSVGREAAGALPEQPAAPAMPQGHGERILVVEDDDRVRRVTVTRLRSLGYTVLEASSGRVALDLLEQETQIDLLFTDMVMPGGMSGPELALEVRRRRPAMSVLFTSGYAEPEALKGIEVNDRWLRKPYTAAELATRLDGIFGARAS